MSTDQQKQADTTTARQAEHVKVVTSETIAAMYSGAPTQQEQANDEPKGDDKATQQAGADGGKEGKKNRFQERISELVGQRNEAESKAERAEREAEELRAKIAAMSARAEPQKEEPKPGRDKFASDEDFIEALADWKANQAIAKREREQIEAQSRAQQEQLASQWQKAQARAKAEIDDYEAVIKASDVNLPGHLHQAILESEVGPHMAYFFAKHPEEAKRFAGMSPTTALRQLGKLEDMLMKDSDPKPEKKSTSATEISKAPPPINPVKDGRAVDPGPAKTFEDYKARRMAERKG